MRKLVLALIMLAGSLRADGEKAGEFDYTAATPKPEFFHGL